MGRRSSILDPRTKLLLVFMEAVFVLATAGGERLYVLRVIFTILPFILLITSKNYKTCITGLVVFIGVTLSERFVFPKLTGMLSYMLLTVITIVTRFLPAFLMGTYVIRTTKVSEFKAAMEKMHIPDELTIPLCVMFRFFPTVKEEMDSIRAAMRMRGISLGGGKVSEMLEYRLVPMMSCSAKIGEELSAAALTRGLGISRKRTNICKIGFGLFDYIMLILCVGTIVFWICGVMI